MIWVVITGQGLGLVLVCLLVHCIVARPYYAVSALETPSQCPCFVLRRILYVSRGPCSMGGNDIGDGGAAAVAAGMARVPLLESLLYVAVAVTT